jgi:anti-sigma factor RsiW
MDCIKNNKQGAEILMDYCAGTADPAVGAEIDAHTKTCAECRTMVEAQSAVWEMLDAWTPAEASRDFDSRLYARIAGEQTGPAWRRWWSRLVEPATPHAWWKPMVSLAVAGVIVSMALIVRIPERQGTVARKSTTQATEQAKVASTGNDAAATEDIDLQQVQQALDDLDVVSPLSPAPANQTAASRL